MSGPPRFPLTYRASLSGRSQAAYAGSVRVGYVDCRGSGGHWIYQLVVLRPEGGAYFGKCETEEDAREMLEQSFYHWMMEAGLRPAPVVTTTPTKETADDQRGDRAARSQGSGEHSDGQPDAGTGERRRARRKSTAKSQ